MVPGITATTQEHTSAICVGQADLTCLAVIIHKACMHSTAYDQQESVPMRRTSTGNLHGGAGSPVSLDEYSCAPAS
jgi:hypothetical protein